MRFTNTVFGVVFLLCVACSHNGSANTSTDSLRLKLEHIYTSQIGVKETTGNNDGPQIKAYLRVTGLAEGHPWCAAFLAWCFREAGIKANRSAYSPAWFPNARITRKPKSGDVIGIYFRQLKRIAHVGFWHRDDGSFIITVEGNTNDAGSREGNRVAKKRRLKRQIRAITNWIDKI